ncbi:MAG: histidine kinase [Bacteroidota bacterium]|nr:histidine kinase [Bacteroidota bacterium]
MTVKQDRKIITLVAHIAVWICFFMLPYIFSPQPNNIPTDVSRYIIALFIVINCYLLGFYYLNTLILIPKLLFKRKWFWYFFSIAALLTTFLYAPKEITNLISGKDDDIIREEIIRFRKQQEPKPPTVADSAKVQPKPQPRNNKKKRPPEKYFPGSYAVFLLVFAVGTSITLMDQWLKIERNRERVEKEMLSTELSFLKSQVNPHFFFNTLNNIYSLAVTGSDKTAPSIMKLSSIMRYILTETKTDKVPLQNEIDFIRDFIELQKVRLTDKVQLDFIVEGNTESQQIAPLIFIPFVENAFKYGVSTKEPSAIHINLASWDNKIDFTVVNTIVKSSNGIHDTTGIGINNVRRRLELLYPNQHTLSVKEEQNQFIVQLEIILK